MVISGAKFETVDYHDIFNELAKVDQEIKSFFKDKDRMTTRAFMNVQLVRAGLTPVYIKVEEKKNYIVALEKADIEKNYDDLYECIFKIMIRSYVELNMNP